MPFELDSVDCSEDVVVSVAPNYDNASIKMNMIHLVYDTRVKRESSIPGFLVRISLILSRSTMRND